MTYFLISLFVIVVVFFIGMVLGGALTKLAEVNSIIDKFYKCLDLKEIDDSITFFVKIEKEKKDEEGRKITKEESWRYN
jgi:hypothetical protein